MRISDWSSDVCSSDLSSGDHQKPVSRPISSCATNSASPQRTSSPSFGVIGAASPPASFATGPTHSWRSRTNEPNFPVSLKVGLRSEERREGKSVSVRVDLGGRRIIKKKNKNQN